MGENEMPIRMLWIRREVLLPALCSDAGSHPRGDRFLRKGVLLHQRLDQGRKTKGFNETLVRLEVEVFLDGDYKAWSMGSGPCRLCKECNVGGLCRRGYEARPSMEACGIDIFRTAKENSFPIDVIRNFDETKNVYGVILVE
jgi:predicted metal-binding protein